MKKRIFIAFIVLFSVLHCSSTTWFPEKKKCPLCNSTNEYMVVGSYGSYIYSWPSKYQFIFWPSTDGQVLYCCTDCKLTLFMWDFESIPDELADSLKTYLKTVDLDKKYKKYYEIPMSLRLEIAEGVYKIMGQNDDWWCWFYRVMGYHYENENEENKALQSRKTALNIAGQLFEDESYDGRQKEYLFIMASMLHFTYGYDEALQILDKAKEYTFSDPTVSAEDAANFNEYLDTLLSELKEMVVKAKN